MSALKKLHPAIQHHIENSLGWPALRPAQEAAIEPILGDHDCLLLPFGTGGETEAAVLPVLSRMISESWGGLSALYICPIQPQLGYLAPRLSQYFGLVGRRVGVWHSEVSTSARRAMLEDPPDLLMTTPESLEGMLIARRVEPAPLLATVRAVIIDDLHAFAGDDRGWHLRALLTRLGSLGRRPPQLIALSASVGNPQGLMRWLTGHGDAVCIRDEDTSADAQVQIDHVEGTGGAAEKIAQLHAGEKRLVFCDGAARVEELVKALRRLGTRVFASYSSLSPEARRAAESAFVQEHDCVIVAAGTLELGADLGDVDRVIQIDAPSSVASFLQRMGRSGRRPGAPRNCLFLTTRPEALLIACALTRLWQDGHIEEVTAPGAPWRVVLQQLLALILEHGALPGADLMARLTRAFPGVSQGRLEELLLHLASTDIVKEQEGRFMLGREGERQFGRRTFRALTTVFLSAPDFLVQHGRREIGYVAPAVLLPEESGPPTLHLGGHVWQVKSVDWRRRRAAVVPVARPTHARWGARGRLPGYALGQAVRELLVDGRSGALLSERAQAQLAAAQERFAHLRAPGANVVTEEAHATRLWTFAGLRCNLTLARALAQQGLKSTATRDANIELPPSSGAALKDSLAQLREALPIAAASFGAELLKLEQLKFGDALPQHFREEVAAHRLLDLPAAETVCASPVQGP